MDLPTAVDRVVVMYGYYSSDKQFQRANEGLVKALVETAVTTSNAYETLHCIILEPTAAHEQLFASRV